MKLDVIMVGGGPAGICMANMCQERDINYIVLEQGDIGESWRRLPEHMNLLSPATPDLDWTSLPGYAIWEEPVDRPFPTRKQFVDYLEKYVKRFKINVKTQSHVTTVNRKKNMFEIRVEGNQVKYETKNLVVASGVIGAPFIPPEIKSLKSVTHSSEYTTRDPYIGKKVCIYGGGNSAAEIAIDLAGWADVSLVHRGELQFALDSRDLDHIRGPSESLLKEYIKLNLIRHYPNSIIKSFSRGKVKFRNKELSADAVISATGYRPNIDFLFKGNLDVKMKPDGCPAVTLRLESVSEPGLFFTGPLTNVYPDSQFIRGFRDDANCIDFDLE